MKKCALLTFLTLCAFLPAIFGANAATAAMSADTKKQNGRNYKAKFLIAFVELILAVAGIVAAGDIYNAFFKYAKTTGIVAEIIYPASDMEDPRIVKVRYEAGGKIYESLPANLLFYREGAQISVYYDPDDPRESVTGLDVISSFVIISISILFIVLRAKGMLFPLRKG
jgi:hypothetical protein